VTYDARQQAFQLRNLSARAEEILPRDPGAFVPDGIRHDPLHTPDAFFDTTIGGVPWEYAWSNWVNLTAFSVIVGDPGIVDSRCVDEP
jgi:hypothetical protein